MTWVWRLSRCLAGRDQHSPMRHWIYSSEGEQSLFPNCLDQVQPRKRLNSGGLSVPSVELGAYHPRLGAPGRVNRLMWFTRASVYLSESLQGNYVEGNPLDRTKPAQARRSRWSWTLISL